MDNFVLATTLVFLVGVTVWILVIVVKKRGDRELKKTLDPVSMASFAAAILLMVPAIVYSIWFQDVSGVIGLIEVLIFAPVVMAVLLVAFGKIRHRLVTPIGKAYTRRLNNDAKKPLVIVPLILRCIIIYLVLVVLFLWYKGALQLSNYQLEWINQFFHFI